MRGDTVWSSLLDGRYIITVRRTGSYRGDFTISDAGQLLHREPVSLSCNALFGPDTVDVSYWKQIAAAFVDRANRP
jgi:hypothetical protein